MANIKVVQVGNIFRNVSRTKFFSDSHFLDYDVLVINLSTVLDEIKSLLFDFESHAYQHKITAYETLLLQRKALLKEFYKSSGIVILFSNINPIFDFQVFPSKKYRIDLIQIFNLMEKESVYVIQSGEIYDLDPILDNLANICKFSYFSFIENNIGVPLMWSKRKKQTISYSLKVENGVFINMPSPDLKDERTGGIRITHTEHLDSFLQLAKTLRDSEEITIAEPDWIQKIHIGDEAKVKSAIQTTEAKINELKIKLDKENVKAHYYSKIKSILYVDGGLLENAVKNCLEHFKINVIKAEGYHVDLIVEHNDFVGVVEVKGLGGSGATKNSRQLENWVNNYALHNEKDAKGILILNTFKNQPLSERNSISFPPDMVQFSETRGHCLMLTIDLLNIYLDYDEKKITTTEIVEILNCTKGVLKYARKG